MGGDLMLEPLHKPFLESEVPPLRPSPPQRDPVSPAPADSSLLGVGIISPVMRVDEIVADQLQRATIQGRASIHVRSGYDILRDERTAASRPILKTRCANNSSVAADAALKAAAPKQMYPSWRYNRRTGDTMVVDTAELSAMLGPDWFTSPGPLPSNQPTLNKRKKGSGS